jgi:hypothetical protein
MPLCGPGRVTMSPVARCSRPAWVRSSPVQIEVGRSAVLAVLTTTNRDCVWAAIQGGTESPAGSGRPITRLAAFTRFAPRPLVLDLADQVSTDLREGMIKVALVGGGHEVRPSR